MPSLDLGEASLPLEITDIDAMMSNVYKAQEPIFAPTPPPAVGDDERYTWRRDMSETERDEREAWISEGRGRSGLRIVIVTGQSARPCKAAPALRRNSAERQKTSCPKSTA